MPHPEQTRDAVDLSLVDAEANVFDAMARDVFGSESNLGMDTSRSLWIVALHLTPKHRIDNFALVGVGGVKPRDYCSIAQDDDRVAKVRHLVEAVGDEDHAYPAGPKLTYRGEKLVDPITRQKGCRLVKHYDARPMDLSCFVNSSCDRDQSSVDLTEIPDLRVRVHHQAYSGERLAAGCALLSPVDPPKQARLVSSDAYVFEH